MPQYHVLIDALPCSDAKLVFSSLRFMSRLLLSARLWFLFAIGVLY